MVRQFTLALLSALFIFSTAPAAFGQAPDVLFETWEFNNTAPTSSTNATGGQWPVTTSWSDTLDSSSGGRTIMTVLSGSVAGNVLSMTSSATGSGSNSSTPAHYRGHYRFTVYVKNPRTTYIQAQTTASLSAQSNGVGSATASYNRVLWGTGGETAEKPAGADTSTYTASASTTATKTVNIGCSLENTEGTKTFAAYPGVTYYRPTGAEFVLVGSDFNANDVSNKSINMSASGTTVLTVTQGTANPTAEITGPYVGGVLTPEPSTGSSVTIQNLSYDGDNNAGTTPLEGICVNYWTLTKPDGSVSHPSGSGSISFTASIPGEYTVQLDITDNDGSTASDSLSFVVQPRQPRPGSDSDDEPEYSIPCEESGAEGGNEPKNVPQFSAGVFFGSGNAQFSKNDPVSTRGYALRNDIYINSQTRFPSRTTVMGNADFTYGIHVRQETISVNGSNETHFFVIDSDGTELDYGITSSAPTPAPGVHAVLSQITGGYTLTGAGEPGEIWRAGNYSYEFDSAGKLIELTDPSGNVQEVTYDGSGYPIEVTDLSTNRSVEYEYDTPGFIARVVEAGGAATVNLAYTSGKLTEIQITDATPTVLTEVDLAYSSGRLSQVVRDGDSASTINFTYQDSGNGVMLANATWSGGGTNINYFGAVGNGGKYRASRTNAQGGVINYDFNAFGDLIALTLPAHNGSGTAPVHTFSYDGSRHLTQWSNGSTTLDFTVNGLGLLTEVDDNAGGVWNYTYSGADLTGISDSVGTVFDIDYNDGSNPHSPTDITDGNGNTWTYAYNAYGQVTSITPPATSPQDPATLTYEENSSSPNYGYLKQVVNGEGDTVDLADYTPLGDVGAISTHPNGSTTNTTEFAYDAMRRITEITNPDATTVQFAYTGRDLTSITDESGNLTEFTWCAVCGKLTGVDMELSKALAWGQNGDHQDTSFVDARSKTTSYTYGTAGELKLATYPDSSVVEYKYDSRGRFDKLVNPRGGVSDLTYNSAGRVSAVAFTNPTQTGMSFTYNDDGTIATATDEAGTTTYTYTDSRQIETIEYDYSAGGLSTVQKLTYTYNDGNC